MIDHVSPDLDQIRSTFSTSDDQPVVMLNLNRYREHAQYPEDHPNCKLGLSGRNAYLQYGIVAQAAVGSVGGRILWATDAAEVVIGCDHDRYDEVVAVWYPNREAFMRLSEFPGYMEAHIHREASVAQSTVIATRGEAEPVLLNPFDALDPGA